MRKTEERLMKSNEKLKARIEMIKKMSSMRDKGYTNVAIADKLNISESTVRHYLGKKS